jgi:hypothetical protein
MKTTIKWFPNASLSEIYQQTGIVFAFATEPDMKTKVQEMCHPWVKCRDFLHDAVRCQITSTGCSIYQFQFKAGTNPPIDLKKMRMLVSKNGLTPDSIADFKRKMGHALLLLNHFEKKAKVSLSTMREIPAEGSSKKSVFLFTGPAMWVKSPHLVSMYTFLIRLGDKELKFSSSATLKKALEELAKTGKGDNDITYLKTMWNKLHDIIKYRSKLFVMKNGLHEIYFDKNVSIHSFHDRCGILNLSRATTPFKQVNTAIKEVIND